LSSCPKWSFSCNYFGLYNFEAEEKKYEDENEGKKHV